MVERRTEVTLARASQMYEAAFKHVEERGHVNLACADAPTEFLGILCIECLTWWRAPHPRRGQLYHWPHDLLEWRQFESTAAGRREFLANGILEAMRRRPRVRVATVWERLVADDDLV
jgi:hypothetical protein